MRDNDFEMAQNAKLVSWISVESRHENVFSV